ncbi:MAG: ATP-binding protein [Pseudomonadota bacterium]
MRTEPDTSAVTLENCAREPIHIPGHVQSHGALFAFTAAGEVTYLSDGAAAFLGVAVPALGEALTASHFDGQPIVATSIAELAAAASTDAFLPQHHEIELAGRPFDLILHRSGENVVAEFETQSQTAAAAASFAIKAHRGMDKLRRQSSIQSLLEVAVEEVRQLTGFDRVMGYRFGHDGSGDVVAEARREHLTPLLNQRYPASDIPEQARRLYVVSTLRLIADVKSQPVPVRGATAAPLDMSHCVLRSVSPVHIEYLTNMGVGASMSISIIVNGELWGMLACHHMMPRLVPYATRMACDVLAQILASSVQTITAAEHAKRVARASQLRTELNTRVLQGSDSSSAMLAMGDELLAVLNASAAIFHESGKTTVHGPLPMPAAKALIEWLAAQPRQPENHLIARDRLSGLEAPLVEGLGKFCGFLAGRFDEFSDSWLVLLREEQVETVAWGHRPAKNVAVGPLGARLTPQGSFDVWWETAKGVALPWIAADIQLARGLFADLARTAALRNAELSKAKDLMMAVLGHDLRSPLATISMAAHVIGKTSDRNEQMSQRIQSSSGRMQRLISQALDISRLQAGLGLGFNPVQTDVSALVDGLVDEVATAHPGTDFVKFIVRGLWADIDPDRVSQMLANLLSNAHHHGTGTAPVEVVVDGDDQRVRIEVRNPAPALPPSVADNLFTPFKQNAQENLRNKGGLGLGLYIAHQIAQGQGGTLVYSYEESDAQGPASERTGGKVVFIATLAR